MRQSKATDRRADPEEKTWRVAFSAIREDVELVERILKEGQTQHGSKLLI
jgi:hypothetical protein